MLGKQALVGLVTFGVLAACTAAVVQQPPSTADGLREAHMWVPVDAIQISGSQSSYESFIIDEQSVSIDGTSYPVGTDFTLYGDRLHGSPSIDDSPATFCMGMVASDGVSAAEQCVTFSKNACPGFTYPWTFTLPEKLESYELQFRWEQCGWGFCNAYTGVSGSGTRIDTGLDLVARW